MQAHRPAHVPKETSLLTWLQASKNGSGICLRLVNTASNLPQLWRIVANLRRMSRVRFWAVRSAFETASVF
jgi:hypothetical protein